MKNLLAAPDRNLPKWIAGALVFYIPFQLHYDYLLNLFYHFGAPYNDAGILAQMAWRGDLMLTPPIVFTNYSFFGVHFTPIFSLLCGLSYFLPTHMVEFYSAFVAFTYASLGLVLFYTFCDFIHPHNPWKITAFAALCIAFSFNGVIMDGIWIGHFEYAIPLGILLFCVHYVRERWYLCIACLLFIFSIREDAGLHLIAIIGLIALIRYYQSRSLKDVRREIIIIACAFVYSVLAMWASLAARGYYSSTFQTIYSGQPAYAHLTGSLLLERAQAIFREHIYLWAGFILTMVQAVRLRNPYLAVGFIAYIPWFLLSWTAINDNPGNLRAYYAYPFVVSLGWPLIGTALHYGLPLPWPAMRDAVVLQVGLIVAALIMWNDGQLEFGPAYGARWGAYELQPSAENSELLREFMLKFEAGEGNLGIVMGDDNALSLVKGHYRGQDMVRIDSKHPADTLIYMRTGAYPVSQQMWDQIKKNGLIHNYCITGTTFCIISKHGPEDLGTFNSLLTEKPMAQ